MIKSGGLATFDQIHAAYTALLTQAPGKALLLPCDGVVFLENGEVYAARLCADGHVQHETAGCISPLAWDEDRGCWECDDNAAVCINAVLEPVLIDLHPSPA